MWTALAVWISRLSTAVTFIILARLLEPANFGLVALASGVIALLTIVSDSGLATYIVRQSELDDVTSSTAFWVSLLLGVVLSAALLVTAPLVADLFDTEGLTPVLRWLSVVLLLAGVNSLPSALLRRDMQFKLLAVRGTVAAIGGSVVAIALAFLGAGVWALVSQALATAVITTAILWSSIEWRPSLRFSGSAARAMTSFGVKLLGIDLLMQARDRGEEFVLASTGSATRLGYWTVATRLIKLLQDTGSQVISTVATPAFSKLQHDPARMAGAYSTSMSLAGLIIFPQMIFLAAAGPDLVPLLLGEQWTSTARIVQITSLTAALGVFTYFDRSVFVAVNRLRPELILVAVIVVVHLLVVVTVAPIGLVPLAIGLLVRAVVFLPVRQVLLHRVAGIPYRSLLLPGRVLLAAGLMGSAVWGLGSALPPSVGAVASLALQATLAVVSYLAGLAVLARPVLTQVRGDLSRLRSRAA